MLSIRRTNKQNHPKIHTLFTKEKKNLKADKQCKKRQRATGTEQIVDFLYAILSFYSSE